MPHLFGGPWTEIKLDAIQYYLECYAKALKRVGFDLWYIDAFAGSGDRVTETVTGGIFGQPTEVIRETLAGSARRALGVQPSFDHFIFIEAWLQKRLKKEFAFVSEPLPLLSSPNRQLFSLFLGVANPSKPAIDLARHFVSHVNKNFAPTASRRKSGR